MFYSLKIFENESESKLETKTNAKIGQFSELPILPFGFSSCRVPKAYRYYSLPPRGCKSEATLIMVPQLDPGHNSNTFTIYIAQSSI